jgi:hypothetical protein
MISTAGTRKALGFLGVQVSDHFGRVRDVREQDGRELAFGLRWRDPHGEMFRRPEVRQGGPDRPERLTARARQKFCRARTAAPHFGQRSRRFAPQFSQNCA